MRKAYSWLASGIALGVVVQAASIALGLGGIIHFVEEGGVVDKAVVESEDASFTGAVGFLVHGIVGGMVIPVLALALLVVSFFVRLPRARTLALVVIGLVVLQTMLGYSIVDLPYIAVLHGANALVVLGTALAAARLARQPDAAGTAGAAVPDAARAGR
jgi:heme A synthase